MILYEINTIILLLYIYRNHYFFPVSVGGGGCASPGLTLNGTRVVPRSGMSTDFSTLSEVKFPARLPSSPVKDAGAVASSSSVVTETSSRICKIKCVSGQWVGPLCQGIYIWFLCDLSRFNMSIRIKTKIYSREPKYDYFIVISVRQLHSLSDQILVLRCVWKRNI